MGDYGKHTKIYNSCPVNEERVQFYTNYHVHSRPTIILERLHLSLLQANGELYYFSTLTAFGVITYVNPKLWISVYDNMGHILGGLNISALVFCLYLLVQAKLKKDEKDPYLLEKVN